MAVSPQSDRPATTPPRGIAEGVPRAPLREAPSWHRWAVMGVGLLLFLLTQRFSGSGGGSLVWFPSAGLGLVLVAWLGPRVVPLLIGAVLTAALFTLVVNGEIASAAGWKSFAGAV